MLTLNQLQKSTKRLRKTTIVPQTEIKITTQIVNQKSGLLRIGAKIQGTSEDKIHVPMIQFYGISFSEKKTTTNTYRFKTKSGKVVWLTKPTKAKTQVQVRCSCTDYRFTFWWWNRESDSHLGKDFPAYERKTDTYPERNALHVPGMCKHIMGLAKMLNLKGILE